jgi:hypothetical protein
VRDQVVKRKIATFGPAHEYTAEHEPDGSLCIYLTASDDELSSGVRVHTGTTHDLSMPERLRQLNSANREFWKARGGMP